MNSDPEREKLDELGARIRKAEGKVPETALETPAPAKFNRTGFDFVGCVLGGAFLGWLLDRYMDTQPWGLIAMIFVGFSVGMVSVWKAMDKK